MYFTQNSPFPCVGLVKVLSITVLCIICFLVIWLWFASFSVFLPPPFTFPADFSSFPFSVSFGVSVPLRRQSSEGRDVQKPKPAPQPHPSPPSGLPVTVKGTADVHAYYAYSATVESTCASTAESGAAFCSGSALLTS